MEPPAPAPDDVELGTIVAGRYRIVEPIARGGMGSIYRAEHLGLRKPVAVKLLHPLGDPDGQTAARFQREAFVSGQLAHPNIVSVIDFGVRDDGTFFLVMELLRGDTLRALIDREGALPWPRALHIARQVLRGLSHAHAQGVVHRDVKPANLFLTPTDDDPDIVKILDFGIAKLVASAAEDGPPLTQVGIAVGTPTYLSPEQARGEDLGPTSDLYSLSVVLYEMLTGEPPFVADTPLEVLRAHIGAPVPPMAELAPSVQVPPVLEALVRDGLAKRARDRIASAADYIARIDAVRAGAATPIEGPAVIVPRPATGRGARLILAAALVLAVVIVGLMATLTTGRAPQVTATAPAPAPALAPEPAAPAAAPEPEHVEIPPAVVDRAALLRAALRDLQGGRTCAARRAAVGRLRALGDPAAIPALRRARHRMEGGFLGLGEKNANACLRADADAAIAELKRGRGDASR